MKDILKVLSFQSKLIVSCLVVIVNFKGSFRRKVLEFPEDSPKPLVKVRVGPGVIALKHNEIRVKNQGNVSESRSKGPGQVIDQVTGCLLYTSDAADD